MVDLNKCEGWQKRDAEGMVMPWYTHPALDEIQTWDLKGKWVVEFGAGQSSIWWDAKGCRVCSVDSNKEWADAIGARYRPIKGGYITFYIDFIDQPVDIICVDGDYRDDCIGIVVRHMKKGQILIVDNWDQPSVWVPNDETRKLVSQLDSTIYKQPGHDDWQTLIATK